MVDNTHVFDLVGEARRRGWCEHELMYHIFEYGVPEGLHSMEAHMKALASSKLIVSVSFGSTALFKWKGKFCPDSDVNSCYLGHGDILVMGGQCQDEANVRTSFFTVRIPVWDRSGLMLRSVESGSILLPALFELG